MNKKADELLKSFAADVKGEHPHEFIPALHWCKVCGVTCRELHSAPLNSILWKECHIGVVEEYKRVTGQWAE